MKNAILKSSICLFFVLLLFSSKGSTPGPIDYLNLGDLLTFNNESYQFKWSSHPIESFYKQEYNKTIEEPLQIHKTLIFEVKLANLKIEEVLKTKAEELDDRKRWDYSANYNITTHKDKPNEGMINFVVCDTNETYEWNVYRYQIQEPNKVVLLGYNYHRVIKDMAELKNFFYVVQSTKGMIINALQKYEIPKIILKK
jgi:hypothetical protein